MVTIYMVKDDARAVMKITGTKKGAYAEMFELEHEGLKPTTKAEYERKKKELRTPTKGNTA